ncbi:MAG: putative toxin-antitoxin system toxin component, PIN family [Chloroflexota bacterium]
MTETIRAVLDTNIFFSATISRNPSSPTREVIERWKRGEFALVMCAQIAEEVAEKLEERDISPDTIESLVETFARFAEWVEVPSEKIESLLSDSDDNVVVACAVLGNAQYLVTYDPHFNTLGGEFRGIKIVKAIPFLEALRNRENKE